MKLMKHITIALALCAIPAVAFGQSVECESCTHQVSVYMGEGGLIATAAGDATMVTYVASCDGVTRSGTLMAGTDGTVSMLMTAENGLACMAGGDSNKLELGPVTDGGWYWITDDSNSAVGNLVAQDVLGNDKTTLTSAGSGVTMDEGAGAFYLKETATGRVGILPNILPEPPEADPPPATLCGEGAKATAPASVGAMTNCMLGGGETKLVVIGPTGYTTGPVDSVVRPYTGSVSFTVSARLDTTKGIYATETTNAVLGRGTTKLPVVDQNGWTEKVEVEGDGPGTTRNLDGVEVEATNGTNDRTYMVSPDTRFCGTATKPLSHTVNVTITPTVTDEIKADFVPALKDYDADTGGNQIASTTVSIMCPSGAASPTQGVELVPENPFPVE